MLRFEYVLDLASYRPFAGEAPNLEMKPPSTDDHEALAVLMLNAYLDTIDYEGETIDEARAEVRGYLDGDPMLSCSLVGRTGGEIVSACLVSRGDHRPIIGYVMTAARSKNQGIASRLLEASLDLLAAEGHDKVAAWITDGNLPSETVFRRAGFVVSRGA